jgi:hypothetical protein
MPNWVREVSHLYPLSQSVDVASSSQFFSFSIPTPPCGMSGLEALPLLFGVDFSLTYHVLSCRFDA